MAVSAELGREELKRLKSRRALHKAALTRCSNFLKEFQLNTADQSALFELKIRLTKLDEAFSKFEDIQSELECAAADEEESTATAEYREEFEATYYHLHAQFQSLISKFSRIELVNPKPEPSTGTSNVAHKPVQLPLLNLPRFEGDYNAWLEFRDSFLALVDRNTVLSNVEKLHHLRSCLCGDALETIRSIPVSNNNYELAWRQLVERYERNHLITSNHVSGILNFPPLAKESGKELRKLHNAVNNHLEALRNLGAPIDEWDLILIPIITAKLDNNTRKEWEKASVSNDTFKVKDLLQLLQQRCEFLERLDSEVFKKTAADSESSKAAKAGGSKFNTRKAFTVASSQVACPHCAEQHALFKCKRFLELPINSRQEVVKQHKVCFNCLKAGHTSKVCIAGGCRKCGMKHNTLLHQDAAQANSEASSTTVTSTYCANNSEALLSTAIVWVMDSKGRRHNARVLLDCGSQANFISKAMFNKLGLAAHAVRLPVKGISQQILDVKYATSLNCRSRVSNYDFQLECLVLDKITDCLPQRSFSIGAATIPDKIRLADPTFAVPGNIDILIGSPTFWRLLGVGQLQLAGGNIILQRTQLGWVISGVMPRDPRQDHGRIIRTHLSLKQHIERFWKLEEVVSPTAQSPEEAEFERIFKSSVRRRDDGRFEVALPLKANLHELGDSYNTARKRFRRLEMTLSKHPQMKDKYTEFMKEYQALGHMTEVPVADNNTEDKLIYYLPHHGVMKQESITTKLRVVFDGSAKTDTGVSINSVLMHGSQQQEDLFNILLRFRKHAVVITSDIEKMYRQVYIQPSHRDLQRILWRESPDERIKEFQLNTVTYGTKCGSFLAIRCLFEIADRISTREPFVSEIIKRDFYVDDLLTGGESEADVLNLRKILTSTLAEYGFHLRKWNSNNESVVQEIKRDSVGLKHLVIEDQLTKTLGIQWDASRDILQYSMQDHTSYGNTKRCILSAIAKIFDPLGLIGPVTVLAKLLMQELWRLKLGWDESLPQSIYTKWKEFQQNWTFIKLMEIPRHAFVSKPIEIKIHGFCDASQVAYGACIYVYSINASGESRVRLLCAKSRVAPIKTISLPKLELCGAVLLSKLVTSVIGALQLTPKEIHLWADSQIVLAWIAKEPIHWKTFVANRVAEIQRCTENMQWRHVSSSDNPADIISRGVHASQLTTSSLWWHGPKWLGLDMSEWPISCSVDDGVSIPERRQASEPILSHAVTTEHDLFDRYSSFRTLQRVVGYILRFAHNASKVKEQRGGFLTSQELDKALIIIVRMVQGDAFKEEISILRQNKEISKTSKLSGLSPILDKDGILRVGGRINKSELQYEQKHPIILPSSHRITELIIQQEHRKQLHAGAQALLCALRLKFWIVRGLRTVKGVLRKCTICVRVKPRFFQHKMGDLPSDRITPAYPFQVCGVDYAGPIDLRISRLRNSKVLKAYICLFVCFVTKAVHIELALDLTSESFLAALKRFIARRGKPATIYSDHGRNFIGSARKLNDGNRLQEFTAQEGIRWKFIPPRSPHFGGLWESAIKSAKQRLKKVIGVTILTYEEMQTLCIQVEGCLNSRPLTAMSSDPNDLCPLTPAHFLIGRHLSAIPEPNVEETQTSRLTRYQLINKMMQQFWSRWSKEYLTSLQQRGKWRQQVPAQPQKDELVIIQEEGMLPLQWRLGRILKLHPGQDGVVRVVDLQTSRGVITRPVAKLCPLPTDP